MGNLSFLFQYIVNPKTVGAVLPSSRFLGDKMIEEIDFQQARYIVEYGAGTGVFTEKLLKKRKPETIILLVESNIEFYFFLKEKFKFEKNFFMINGSAENIEHHLKECSIPYADYVISGLPFTSLPKQVSYKILFNTTKILNRDGQFVTFQYTKFKKALIEHFFTKIDMKREFRNIPPAYIFSCSLQEKGVEEYDGVQSSYC